MEIIVANMHKQLVEVVLDATDAPLNVLLCGAAIDDFNKRKQM
jgi:hypothetical protein